MRGRESKKFQPTARRRKRWSQHVRPCFYFLSERRDDSVIEISFGTMCWSGEKNSDMSSPSQQYWSDCGKAQHTRLHDLLKDTAGRYPSWEIDPDASVVQVFLQPNRCYKVVAIWLGVPELTGSQNDASSSNLPTTERSLQCLTNELGICLFRCIAQFGLSFCCATNMCEWRLDSGFE